MSNNTIDYEKSINDSNVSKDITVDGDGEICVPYPAGGCWSGSQTEYLYFPIKQLEIILANAKSHYNAYQAYKDSGYEVEIYHNSYIDPTLEQNRIVQLENALQDLINVAHECDSWESFPSKPLEDAKSVLDAKL